MFEGSNAIITLPRQTKLHTQRTSYWFILEK